MQRLLGSLLLLLLSAGSAGAAPIYLKGGQCIQIGSQEVCAMQADAPGANAPAKANIMHSCRYGFHPGAEVNDVKSYALFQVIVKPDGGKTETLMRNYGINDSDKQSCDKEADRLNDDERAKR